MLLYIQMIKKLRNVFIYKNQDSLQNQDSFRYVFIYKKPHPLRYAIFHEFFKLRFIYKKYDTLRYVTVLYAKSQTLRKNLDNLRYVFIYKNTEFCVT